MDRCYLEASQICPNLVSTVFCIEPKRRKKKKREEEEEEEEDGFCIMEAEEEDVRFVASVAASSVLMLM